MFCGKCGAQVPDGYEFCMKCGAKIEQVLEYENNKPKKKKWLIYLTAVVCVIVIVVTTLFFINDAKKKNGLFNNIAWGTSFENIKEIVDKRNGDEEVQADSNQSLVFDVIDGYENDKDITAMVIYDCQDDDTLHKVQLFISNSDDSKYTGRILYDKCAEKLTELYGKSKDDTIGEIWTTKKSQIKLIYFTETLITIDYTDLNTVEFE